jgi:hypothetical protein
MRFVNLFAAVVTTLAVPAAVAIHGARQQPVSVYLHPSPGHHHGSHVPTLTGEQAEVVFAHHFGIGLNPEEYEKYLHGKVDVSDPVGGGHGEPLTETQQPKVVVIQGDVKTSDILPSTISGRPAFHLPAIPDEHTMRFVQPYLMQGQQTVARFVENVKDNLEQGFDEIWSTVQGSKAGKWLGDAFDVNTSRKFTGPLVVDAMIPAVLTVLLSESIGSAEILHAELSALSDFVENLRKPSSGSTKSTEPETTVITALGNQEDEGVDGEVRKLGLNVVKASLQAVSARSRRAHS